MESEQPRQVQWLGSAKSVGAKGGGAARPVLSWRGRLGLLLTVALLGCGLFPGLCPPPAWAQGEDGEPPTSAARQGRERAQRSLNQALKDLQEQNYQRAIRSFEEGARLLASLPPDPFEDLQRAEGLLRQGQPQQAEELARRFQNHPEAKGYALQIMVEARVARRAFNEALEGLATMLGQEKYAPWAVGKASAIFSTTNTWPQAIHWFNRLPQAIQDKPLSRHLLATIKDHSGDSAGARALWQELLDHPEVGFEVVSGLMRSWIEYDGQAAAVKRFEELAARYPNSKPINRGLIRLYEKAKDWEKALPLLRHANQQDPMDANLQFKLSQAATKCRQWDEAIKAGKGVLEKLRGHLEDSIPVRFELAKTLYLAGRYEEALKELIQVDVDSKKTSPDPDQPAVIFWTGQTLFKLKRFEEAELQFKRFNQFTNYNDPETYKMLGEMYAQRESWPEAAKAFQRALDNNKPDLELMILAGEAMLKAGGQANIAESGVIAQKAFDIAQANPERDKAQWARLLLLLSRSQQKNGRHELALQTARRLLGEEPQHGEALFLEVESLTGLGKREEALSRLESIPASLRAGAGWLMLRGRINMQLRNFAQAKEAFDQVTRDFPQLVEGHLGKADLALEHSLVLESDKQQAAALKLVKQAADDLRRASNLRPGDQGLADRLHQVELRRASLQGALESSASNLMLLIAFIGGTLVFAAPFAWLLRRWRIDNNKRAWDFLEKMEKDLRRFIEKHARGPVEEASEHPPGSEQALFAWQEAVVKSLPSSDHTASLLKKLAEMSASERVGADILSMLYLSELVALIDRVGNKSNLISSSLYPHLGTPTVAKAIIHDLRFLKNCRNTLAHMKDLEKDEAKRFFLTIKPILKRLKAVEKDLSKMEKSAA